jgi:hypothetical protein
MKSAYNYGQKGSYSTTNQAKTNSYTTSNATKNQYQGRGVNQAGNSGSSKYGISRTNETKWQNSKPDSKQQNYGGRHIGDTQTKVETTQDGDYIIKVTTTRRVIDKKDYYDSLNGKKKY